MRVLMQNEEMLDKQGWFELPMAEPTECLKETYRLIKIARKPDGYLARLMVADVECDVSNLMEHIKPLTPIESIDKLYFALEKMTEEQKYELENELNIRQTETIEDGLTIAKEINTPAMVFSMIGGF